MLSEFEKFPDWAFNEKKNKTKNRKNKRKRHVLNNDLWGP